MTTAVLNPEEEYKMSPEMLEVVTTYVETSDVNETARALSIPKEKVIYYVNKSEAKRFIDTIFLEQGYLNRNKIQEALTRIIEMKLEEMEESELGSNKDIAELLALAHKIRMEEIKANPDPKGPTSQTNVQINSALPFGGDNYNELMNKLLGEN